MRLPKYFLKTCVILSLFSISYALSCIFILYSQNEYTMPDLVRETIEAVVCNHAENTLLYQINNLDDNAQPPDAIYFHKTSRQWTLQLREACSIEAAARAHPNREVNVVCGVVCGHSVKENACRSGVLDALATSDISNLNYQRVDLLTYAENTPLQDVLAPRLTWLGKWHYRKIRELLKFLTLYKFGGTVIDLDVMVVGSLDSLGQDWASQDGRGVESRIISVSNGLAGKFYARKFLNALKHQITYDGVINTPSALTQAVESLCNTTDVRQMNRERCKGFRLYSDQFYNLDDGNIKATNTSRTYLGFHLWNETVGDHRTAMASDSLYAILARMNCPVVYNGFMATDRNSRYIHL